MQRPVLFRFSLVVSSLVWIALLFTLAVPRVSAQTNAFARPWLNAAQTPDQRADELIAQMTLAEKIAMLGGAGGSYVGNIPANTRLGIPALSLEDGPAGVADGMSGVTAFPAPVGIAASWDTSLMNQYGQDLGAEEYGKGANVALAPTVNILRNPVWGRSFESLGEDPYLTSQMGVADIQGIQSQYVIATVKHYVANNQEYDRTTDSSNVDERTLQEIYMPAFDAAVQQGSVGAVMCSYNKVNDIYACEQPYTLNDVLKTQMNFPGFVMSDWGATHSTLQAAAAGLDMQMPDSSFYGSALQTAEQNGQVTIQTINEMVHRILRTMFAIGLFDHPTSGSPGANVATAAHNQFTETASEQSTVLLQNNGAILPLHTGSLSSIAVIGSDASTSPMIAGNGSAHVNASSVVTPLQGITSRAGSGVKVQYAEGVIANGGEPTITSQYLAPSSGSGPGLYAQFYNNMTLSGSPVLTRVDPQVDFNWNGNSPGSGVNADQWSAKWTGTITAPQTGTYTFSITSDDGSRLYINGQELIDNWRDQASTTETATISLNAGQSYSIEADYYQNGGASNMTLGWLLPDGSNSPVNQASALAKSSSVAVVFANDEESEGSDRSNLSLPFNQDQLIAAVAQANPNTIVVLNTGAPVLMPWLNQVKGVLEAWYPGQEDGNAIAAVLFGDVNPSGKLPMTFPASNSQVPANTQGQYPGTNDESAYSEGLDVGYRYYDANNLTPLFPFGYGLSYTSFSYSNLTISGSGAFNSPVTVSATVTNTGSVSGADVAQLYVGFPSSAGEPPKILKGFQKVTLSPGQSQSVSFTLNSSAFSYWDTTAHNWVVPQGTFQLLLGDSSRNLPLRGSYQITTPSYNSPAQAFNDAGTSDNSNPSAGNFDGAGYSYSAQNLAAVGLTPGAVVTHDGVSFTWPNASSGQPNNITTTGQTIMYSGAGDTLGFLGAGTFGTQSGSGTITYTDGSTQQFTLTFADWYANAPASGDELLATTSNWNQPSGGIGNHQVSVYYTSVALNPTKAIQSITLPNNSKLHVFALGLDSLQQAYNNVGISDNSNPASGNLDGHGYSYSAQSLAAAGMMPGSVVSHDGVLFTWPDVAAGQQDNVVAAGQTLTLSGSGGILAILGAGAFGTQSGTATITYTDGTSQTFTLSFADWYANSPVAGTEIAATTTNWNVPGGDTIGNHQVSVYYTAVGLQSGKTVASITLPNNSKLHVFAMTVQ